MHIRTGCCYIKSWNFYSKQLDTELVSLIIVRGDNFKYVNLHKNDKENRFLRTSFWSTRTELSILYFSFERKPGKIETNVNPANHILCISLLTSIVVLRERLYWFREQLYDYGTFMLGYNIPGILTFETSILRNRWTLAVMVVTFLIEAANRQEKSHATGLTNREWINEQSRSKVSDFSISSIRWANSINHYDCTRRTRREERDVVKATTKYLNHRRTIWSRLKAELQLYFIKLIRRLIA